jgi:nucleotide-binding universal stress UspA family protein
VKKGHPVPSLLEEVGAQHADVIVVGRHSGPALAQRLLGSVTQTVLHRAPCDVLLVP